MDEERAQHAMQIILHAGDARLKTTNALRALETFDYERASALMDEAQQDILAAHQVQTGELQREASGEVPEYSVLLTHAQDTCMTVASEMDIARRLIALTQALDRRIDEKLDDVAEHK